MKVNKFELTLEHIMLARKLNFDWSNEYYLGAPCVNVKCPYQDSDVLMSIAEIIGLVIFEDEYKEKYLSEEQAKYCEKLHKEMHIAISVMLASADFKPGTYQTREYSNIDWEPVKS